MKERVIRFSFEAAHILGREFPEELQTIHGHSWKGRAVFRVPQGEDVKKADLSKAVDVVVKKYDLSLIVNRLSAELINVSKRWEMKYKAVEGDPTSVNIAGAMKKEIGRKAPKRAKLHSVDINLTCS